MTVTDENDNVNFITPGEWGFETFVNPCRIYDDDIDHFKSGIFDSRHVLIEYYDSDGFEHYDISTDITRIFPEGISELTVFETNFKTLDTTVINKYYVIMKRSVLKDGVYITKPYFRVMCDNKVIVEVGN
jgi:hypothetical protein